MADEAGERELVVGNLKVDRNNGDGFHRMDRRCPLLRPSGAGVRDPPNFVSDDRANVATADREVGSSVCHP
jgi:hypothetical protein